MLLEHYACSFVTNYLKDPFRVFLKQIKSLTFNQILGNQFIHRYKLLIIKENTRNKIEGLRIKRHKIQG